MDDGAFGIVLAEITFRVIQHIFVLYPLNVDWDHPTCFARTFSIKNGEAKVNIPDKTARWK